MSFGMKPSMVENCIFKTAPSKTNISVSLIRTKRLKSLEGKRFHDRNSFLIHSD